jgi:hypothetical protein
MEEQVASKLNESLTSIVSQRHSYDAVYALLISWAETDDAKIADEVEAVRNLFESDFGFVVSKYAIPSDRSGANLQHTLTTLCIQNGEGKNNLLILYYAGHGDASPEKRRAVWAAKRVGGPTLNWYEVMPSAYAWGGDILMILDCCYALQASRGRDDRTVELLAASGLLEMTPPAGDWSFTTRFIRVVSEKLGLLSSSPSSSHPEGCLTVEDIYTALLQLSGKDMVRTTPARLLLRGHGESIRLRPHKANLETPGKASAKPSTLLSLTISLTSSFDDKALQRFHKWLRTHMPSDVSAITVDQVFLRTELIQAWLQRPQKRGLKVAVADEMRARGHLDTIVLQPSVFEEDQRAEPEEAFQRLQSWNESVYGCIQSNVLLNPAFSNPQDLEGVRDDRQARELGLSEAAHLRLLNARLQGGFDYSSMSALPRGYISEVLDYGTLAAGQHRDSDRLLVVEKRRYGEGADPKDLVLSKIQKLSRLLSEVSSPAFHITRFVGYVDQPLRSQMGLVFETNIPATIPHRIDMPPFMTLELCYRQEKLVPLEMRFALALSLAKALSNLHAVGWLHKSLRSANVVFFASSHEDLPGGKSRFDLTHPYLFGFDLSRHSADPSAGDREFKRGRQIYTHPRRWGVPREAFYAVHDIYALGVILLEVGCWRAASGFDPANKGFSDVNDEAEIQERLVGAAETYLRHMAGGSYCRAVLACLTNGFEEEARDVQDPMRLHRAFEERVVGNLARAVVGVKGR